VTADELSIPIKWEKVQDRDYGDDICVLHPQPTDSGKTIELRYHVVRLEKPLIPRVAKMSRAICARKSWCR
jgi:hypothetical protein